MAKIPQGILGGLRGRVGNVVGAAWKGINYIRSMPLSVANPNTALQQAQRGAFTQTVLVARLLLADLIASYWDPFARRMSGYNHFISVCIDAFTTAGLTTPNLFYSGRGILTGVVDLVVTAATGVNVTFTWTDNSGAGDALAGDFAIAVYHNVDQDYWEYSALSGAVRSDTTGAKADTRLQASDVIEGYLFFTRPDIEKISDSTHDQGVVA